MNNQKNNRNHNTSSTTERLLPIHPGEVLLKEFMKPFGLTATRLARKIGVTPPRIWEILNGRRSITADTALRLAKHFRTDARFWLELQIDYELYQAERKLEGNIEEDGIEHDIPTPTAILTRIPKNLKNLKGSINITSKSLKEYFKRQRTNRHLNRAAEKKLSAAQKKVYSLLYHQEPICFDILLSKSRLSVGDLSAALSMLELEGFVERLPGDSYTKRLIAGKRLRE